ncbi:MAG: tripartite tricarboxylate transporter substrate binding protein [Alphaproteobacteria bacterium]|nr:tripartite tricarboxylate transporter substrate binding protein [Alphaproteobacteria bacterium]
MHRRRLLLLPLLAAPALAQASWPQARPVRIIVPFPPGGATDIVGRIAAQRLSQQLGAQFVVENRAGAGGTVGTDVAAKAAPDGYTLLISNIASNGVAAGVYRNLPYNPLTDFTHVALLADTPSVLAVNVSSPATTLAEFITLSRRTQGGLSVGSPGNGSSSHVMIETLRRASGAQLVHVPFRGSAPAITDLVAGNIGGLITTMAETLANPRLRLLASTSAQRVPAAPDLPTFAELGVPHLTAPTWFGLSGPAGLPDAIADRRHAESMVLLAAPEVRERLTALVALPGRLSRAEYQAFVAAEVRRWTEQARAANATAE